MAGFGVGGLEDRPWPETGNGVGPEYKTLPQGYIGPVIAPLTLNAVSAAAVSRAFGFASEEDAVPDMFAGPELRESVRYDLVQELLLEVRDACKDEDWLLMEGLLIRLAAEALSWVQSIYVEELKDPGPWVLDNAIGRRRRRDRLRGPYGGV